LLDKAGRAGSKRSRREFVRGAALAAFALAVSGLPAGCDEATRAKSRSEGASTAADVDALHRRVRAELKVFTDWLETNGVQGYIGEVGWPDDARGDHGRWNALAEAWFEDADAARLWVSVWATGEWMEGDSDPLAVYERWHGGPGVNTANTQASVVEAHPSNEDYLRGVTVCGGEFGTAGPLAKKSRFSNMRPGDYNTDYHYDRQETFTYLGQRGVRLVRLPFRWERVQTTLGGELDATELGRLRGAVARARIAGLDVLLDMHGYGAYYLGDGDRGVRRAIGSAEVTRAHFADAWRRISAAFKEDPGVIGYGLMAEPVAMPAPAGLSAAEGWERASQKALDAIRANGDGKLVTVSGYEWAGVQRWPEQHPDKWINDAANNHRYEGHHYWDRDHSGDYKRSYAKEVVHARARGY
jgi:hypothetical protein